MLLINDFKTSVKKALSEIDSNWESYDGLIVCGTHSQEQNIDPILEKIKEYRESNRPFLGICMGLHLAIVEYARNVWGVKEATTEELNDCPRHTFQVKDYHGGDFDPPSKCSCPPFMVVRMPELRVGIRNVNGRMESHWHNYRASHEAVRYLQKSFKITMSEDGILEEMSLPDHPFFWGVQYHPEYQTSKEKPHFLLKDFLNSCSQHQK